MQQQVTKTKVAAIHDFARKLRQPSVLSQLKQYVLWQAALRKNKAFDDPRNFAPNFAPLSINLDLTTSCNYRCDHCVDIDILNTGIHYDFERLKESIALLQKKGLRSVILIGGGEPTLFPKFEEMVHFLKDLDLQVAIVSNGAGNLRIENVAERFTKHDWVRLSLDSGTDKTFQLMHKPRKPITLNKICEGVRAIKVKHPNLSVGFSFIIVWRDAHNGSATIVENIQEIVSATKRARDYGFDYISLKPFLVRAEQNNAEIVGVSTQSRDFDEIIRSIRQEVEKAKELETDKFRVVESTNLRVMESKTSHEYMKQPAMCHMTFFRQVISPLGVFLCPVYRHVPHAQLGAKDAYAGLEKYQATRARLKERIVNFNATHECKEVTCLYNATNWWIEDLIQHPERLESLEAAEENYDYYL